MIRSGFCAHAGATMLAMAALLISQAVAQTRQQIDWCVNKGNVFSPDQQINGCTAAIQSGRGMEHGASGGYTSRGVAYRDKGDYDRAIADYNEAIRLDPKNSIAYGNRGNVYKDKGDYDRAIADYNEAIRLDPKNFKVYLNRGLANLYAGSLAKALADVNRSSELDPKYAYAALWLDIVGKRANLPSRLAEMVKQIDMSKWPAPIIRLYLGQMTPEAVLAAADDPDANTKKGNVCEANFYVGELTLSHAKDEAIRMFRLAAADCPKSFRELAAANAELKALGVK